MDTIKDFVKCNMNMNVPVKSGKNVYSFNSFILCFAAVFLLHLIIIYIISPFTYFHFRQKEITDISMVSPDEFPGIRINNGERYLNEGKLDEALAQFSKALASDPSSVPALNKAGWVLLLQKKPDKSIEKLNRSIEINPNDPETYMMRAGAYISKKYWGRAMNDYKKASELSPDNPDIYFGMGRLCLTKKDFEKAEKYFNKALETHPNHPIYLLSRSFAYINQAKHKKAKQDAETVLKNPDIDMDTRIGALLAIAEIEAVSEHNPKKAKQIYDEVLKMREELTREKKLIKMDTGKHRLFDVGFDHRENPHMGRAVIYMDNRQYDKALQELELALNDPIDPKRAAWLYMTVVYYRMGEREKAKETAKKWFSGTGYDIEHYHEEELASYEAIAYMVVGDFDNALKKIDYSISQDREFIFNRALIYIEKGDNESARRDLEDYVREFPEKDNPEIVRDIRKAKEILDRL